MLYKNEFVKIDTEEKAYFLGFMYGDGCISKYEESDGSIRHQTKISIAIKDEKLIHRLKELFSFFYVYEFDFSKYNKNCSKQISISSRSKKLFNDLKNHGLFVRKSYENKEKLKIPNINKNLIKHFIRGFFDADGYVCKIKLRHNLLDVGFTSNSFSFINDVNNFLIDNNINAWKIAERKPTGRGISTYYNLIFTKRVEIMKFKDFIYKDSTIFLDRKKVFFDNFKIVNKILDRKISCPSCNSISTIKNGKRNNRTRMKCKSCKLHFTI